MALTRDQVKAAAMELDVLEREALVDELNMLLRGETQADIDAAWLAEAHRRFAEFKAGRIEAIPAEEVMARIANRVRQ